MVTSQTFKAPHYVPAEWVPPAKLYKQLMVVNIQRDQDEWADVASGPGSQGHNHILNLSSRPGTRKPSLTDGLYIHLKGIVFQMLYKTPAIYET